MRSRASRTSAGGDRAPPMTMVLHRRQVELVEVGLAQQQGQLGRHAADAGHVVLGDEAQHVVGPPPVDQVHGAGGAQVPGQLGHEPDVGQLGARQHGRAAAPAAAGVGLAHGGQLGLAEHRALGGAGRARGQHDGHRAVGVGGERGRRLAGRGRGAARHRTSSAAVGPLDRARRARSAAEARRPASAVASMSVGSTTSTMAARSGRWTGG